MKKYFDTDSFVIPIKTKDFDKNKSCKRRIQYFNLLKRKTNFSRKNIKWKML